MGFRVRAIEINKFGDPYDRSFPETMSTQDNNLIKTISPIDGSIILQTKCHSVSEISSILHTATQAFKTHKSTALRTRTAIASKFLDLLTQHRDELVLFK